MFNYYFDENRLTEEIYQAACPMFKSLKEHIKWCEENPIIGKSMGRILIIREKTFEECERKIAILHATIETLPPPLPFDVKLARFYTYKGQFYHVLGEEEMKHPTTREWVPSVRYAQLKYPPKKGQILAYKADLKPFVREKSEFVRLFKAHS